MDPLVCSTLYYTSLQNNYVFFVFLHNKKEKERIQYYSTTWRTQTNIIPSLLWCILRPLRMTLILTNTIIFFLSKEEHRCRSIPIPSRIRPMVRYTWITFEWPASIASCMDGAPSCATSPSTRACFALFCFVIILLYFFWFHRITNSLKNTKNGSWPILERTNLSLFIAECICSQAELFLAFSIRRT